MFRKINIFFTILAGLIFPVVTQAVCPVCTVAVGAGLGLSRWLGIDDTITGLWVGGLIISITFWTVDWLVRKNIKFKGIWILTAAIYYAAVVIPLYCKGIICHPFNALWGIDKFIVGIIIGSIFFLGSALYYNYSKKKNEDKPHFPYEKIVLNIVPLIILSFVFYFITK